MDIITNEDQLRDALQTYANERRVGNCGSKTPIVMTKPITIKQQVCDGFPWGVNLNFTRLFWQGPAGQDMITYQGVNGVENRGLFLEKMCMDGNGYAAAPAGNCLRIYAPDGDPGSIYKFTLRDIFTGYATHGVALSGAVFEGLMENIHAENHTSDGIFMESLGLDGMSPWSIVSNVMCVHPNSSRNMGAGIKTVNSANYLFGSFVLNAMGGIVAPDGLRLAIGNNGENTGESLFVVPYAGWGSLLFANEASTDANTHARKFENGQWVSVGKPMLYNIDNVNKDVPQEHNLIAYYGDGSNADKVMVVKP
jgi:hypothetical protein